MSSSPSNQLLREGLRTIAELKAQLRRAEARWTEPIAIVSMACRAPGGVTDPEGYWELLKEGRDGIGPFPDRWDVEALYDPEPGAEGKSYAKEGGFLQNIERFDPGFFGISPREARAMDPQQRLVLEVAWEALERAGIVPAVLGESRTGVYVGSIDSDYGMDRHDAAAVRSLAGTGTLASVTAGRLSYVLGLQGPAIMVDTACSSALTALHLACSGLRLKECDLALAGGVQVMSTPMSFVSSSHHGLLARDGRCKAFSASADGAGWAEGCGILILKRLSDAEAAGDRILALIRGSAVNQDGRSQGLTAPNGPSQQRVIKQALRVSGLVPNDIDAIEAHGTGTNLGDPIEAGALMEVFGATRAAERPLWLGSSKSNIGHAQAAAGVLGVMKMVLALQHEYLPQTLHAASPSEHIAWEGSGLSLLQETRPWPRSADHVRRAGVSSFGISGTNVHAVLEEAPTHRASTPSVPASAEFLPLLISGRNEAALRAQAERWSAWLKDHPNIPWASIVRTAALHRTHYHTRAALAVNNVSEAISALTALAEGRPHPAVALGEALGGEQSRGKVVFVFPGQGSQWAGMGRVLLNESSVFAEAIAACDEALFPHTGWSVAAVLRGDEGHEVPSLEQVDVAQPALFAMGIGLAAVWRSLGVEPHAVVGHSQGEIVAAVVSGALSVADGAKIVAVRSRLVKRLSGRGGMAVVALPAEEVAERLESYSGALSIAVINTPDSTVIAGDDGAIDAFVSQLTEEGTFCRRVDVDYASHSAHVDAILKELRAALSEVSPQSSTIPMVSTVIGEPIESQKLDATYWCRNLRETVRLDRALETLIEDGHGVFVEVSAHPVLAMPLTKVCAETGGVVTGSLRREDGSLAVLYNNLAALHIMGHPVDWTELFGDTAGRLAALPTYAFQRERYWLETHSRNADLASAGLSSSTHPMLGAMTSLADSDEFLFTARLSRSEPSWIADHEVFDTLLMPGTGLVELALAAAQVVGEQTLRELVLNAPLILPDEGALRLQLRIDASDARGVRSLAIYSRLDDAPEDTPWIRHASGLCGLGDAALAAPADLATWPPVGARACDLDGYYSRLASSGYGLGPIFQGLREAWVEDDTFYGRVVLPESTTETAMGYGVHPALLDAALQTTGVGGMDALTSGEVKLPFAWNDVTLHAAGSRELRVRIQIQASAGPDEIKESLTAWDIDGRPVLTVSALRLRSASVEQVRKANRVTQRDLYRVDWQPTEVPDAAAVETAGWVVIGGDGRLAELLGVATFVDFAALHDALEAGTPTPERAIVDATRGHEKSTEFSAAVHRSAAAGLAGLQAVLDSPQLGSTAIVWVTRSAIATEIDDLVEGLLHAPWWGLLRSARSEHPDRVLRLVDLDATDLDAEQLSATLGLDDEPEVALRSGSRYVPRLIAATVRNEALPSDTDEATDVPPEGTVLITGGLGELGQAVAKHLVAEHGERHLLLTSRRGMDAPGAAELKASLEESDAVRVTIAACDIIDRAAVAKLLSSIPEDRPLRAVFHLAGVLDDGMVRELTEERLSRVLRPKVDGALHLHELTVDMDLSAFVLFSSGAGIMGGAGQANYAAANSFLDALVGYRRGRRLPGLSLAWGLWEQQGVGMTAHLGSADLSRMRRQGFAPISVDAGLALLDAALERPDALLVPIRMDLARMQREFAATSTQAPALLRALIRPVLRRVQTTAADAATLRTRLAALAESERLDALISLVQEEAAAVLGLTGSDAVPSDASLKDLGMDSLLAVELRNRLSAQTETTLPVTLAFDYPTPKAVADLLLKQAFTELDNFKPSAASPKAEAHSDADLAVPAWIHYCNKIQTIPAVAYDLPTLGILAQARYREEQLTSPTGPVEMLQPERIFEGPDMSIVLVPTFAPSPATLQFAHLLPYLQGNYTTYGLRHSGYAAGERLMNWDEMLTCHSAGIRATAQGPIVLVGHSSSGWIAMAVATTIHEQEPDREVRVVLLDSPPVAIFSEFPSERARQDSMQNMMQAMLDGGARVLLVAGGADTYHWSALGWYQNVMSLYSPQPTDIPVLFLRAPALIPYFQELAERFPQQINAPAMGWESICSNLQSAEVPGDHFTLVREPHVGVLADVLNSWLGSSKGKG